jgi:hypothetical protein
MVSAGPLVEARRNHIFELFWDELAYLIILSHEKTVKCFCYLMPYLGAASRIYCVHLIVICSREDYSITTLPEQFN